LVQGVMRIPKRLIEIERFSLCQNMRILAPNFIEVTALCFFVRICYRNDRPVSFIVSLSRFRAVCDILVLRS